MIKLFIIAGLILPGCKSAKSVQSISVRDSLSELPACIKNKIGSFKLKETNERPRRVVEYSYKGRHVYYVAMPCCDFFNEVYDEQCNLLGSPDGGFTGKGDGRLPDFFEKATGKKLIWGTPE